MSSYLQHPSHPENIEASLCPCLQIAVTDTGIGISPDHLKQLFQPFVQIDSALNRQYAGTGLGLVLVKRIVELHGGRVNVTSEVGVGSCFTILLPCLVDAPISPQGDVQQETDSEPDHKQQGRQPLILLTEDNKANLTHILQY